jgi:hypothetical protein
MTLGDNAVNWMARFCALPSSLVRERSQLENPERCVFERDTAVPWAHGEEGWDRPADQRAEPGAVSPVTRELS